MVEVLELGIGPIKANGDNQMLNLAAVDPKQLLPLVEAFIKELVYVNRLDSLQDCVVDASSVASELHEIFSLFQSGEEGEAVTKATKLAIKIMLLIPKQC